jgi:hypothetical protein
MPNSLCASVLNELLSFAKVMEHYPFYYIPLTFILSPDYGGEDKGEGV